MTTTLILLLYFADVAEKLLFISVSGAAVTVILIFCFFFGEIREDQVEHKVRLVIISTVVGLSFLLLACFLPSKQTIYGAAAIYVGAEVANSEELQLVRQLVVKELKKTVEAK